VTLSLAETSVVKSRPSVSHGTNLSQLLCIYMGPNNFKIIFIIDRPTYGAYILTTSTIMTVLQQL